MSLKRSRQMIPTVKEIMTQKVCAVDCATTVKRTAEIMSEKKIGSLLVSKGEQTIGIVTETDMVRKVLATGLDPLTTKVERVMSSPLITITADKSVVEANDLMERNHIRHLAVTENGSVVGVVSVRDLLHPISVEGENR